MDKDKKDPWIYKSSFTPITAEEVEKDAKERLSLIHKEFSEGFTFIRKYPKSVTIFGSSLLSDDDLHYKQARSLAGKLSKLGYTIVTGGGPGIMEAASRGAFEAGGQSVGLNIKLPYEQNVNKYLTDRYEFYYFFSRKVVLSFAAEAYIFFPGGFGTLNEFFEIVTLVQTNRINRVPLILVGSDFWKPFTNLIEKHLFGTYKTIKKEDSGIYCVMDKEEEIIEKVKSSPIIETVPFKKERASSGEF